MNFKLNFLMVECAFMVGNGKVQFVARCISTGYSDFTEFSTMDCRFFQILRRGPIMTCICYLREGL